MFDAAFMEEFGASTPSAIARRTRSTIHPFLVTVALLTVTLLSSSCGDAGDPVILGADRNTEKRNSLIISPSEIFLTEGDTLPLKVSLTGPSSATFDPAQVTWSVDDASVATIGERGVLTALRQGEVRVTASYGNLEAVAPARVKGIPRSVQALTSQDLSGAVGRPLDEEIRVRVLDKESYPISQVEVGFEVISGRGWVGEAASFTDEEGYARTEWTLGPDLGIQELGVSVEELSQVVLSAEALPDYLSARVEIVQGDGQEGEVATFLPEPLMVQVVDTFGHALPGVSVLWAFDGGGGSNSAPPSNLSPIPDLSSTTDGNGITQTYWELGTRAGIQEAVASIDSVSSGSSGVAAENGASGNKGGRGKKFWASARPGKPKSISIDPAATSIAPGEKKTFSASVSDRFGNPITETDLFWSTDQETVIRVDQYGTVEALRPGSAEVSAAIGNVRGTASVEVKYGSSPAVSAVEIVPATAEIQVGQQQQFAAKALDDAGNILSGKTFLWTSGDPDVASVNEEGLAAGVSAGTVTLSAEVDGVTGTAALTVSPLAAEELQKTGGDGQTGMVGTALTQPLRVRVVDGTGAGVQGREVSWVVTGGKGSLSAATSTTDAEGYAQTTWVLGTLPGDNTAMASVASVGSVTFEATATAGPVASVAVHPVYVELVVGETYQFTVVAEDRYGNGLSAVDVTWASESSGIATVTGEGLVAGVSEGTTEIRAVVEGVQGTGSVTVAEAGSGGGGTYSVVPELPQSYVDTSMPVVTGNTIRVAGGGNLQNAINSAQPGDEILLEAGATFTGNYNLPKKSGTGWIIIRTDTSLPSEGTRMTPGAAGQLATIQAGNDEPAIRMSRGAGYYRFVGVEFTVKSTVSLTYAIVSLDGNHSQLSDVPHDVILDRVYCHGHSGLDARRCVLLNAYRSAVIDSYISEVHSEEGDAQAILGYNSPGPMKIVNNFLEASGENVMFGGADPSGPDLSPSDIEIRRNHFYKDPAWYAAGKKWSVKNLFELKNAKRLLVEGNVFENSWTDSQNGFAMVFKTANQQGGCSYCETRDLTFRYNRIDNVAAGIDLSGWDDNTNAVPMNTVLIHDNLLTRIGSDSDWGDGGNGGRAFQILSGIDDLEISHNTAILPNRGGTAAFMEARQKVDNLVVLNNIIGQGEYGWAGTGTSEGTNTLNTYAASWRFEGNAIYRASASSYPAGNFFPSSLDAVGFVDPNGGDYRLSAGSSLRGQATDGGDPGANISDLDAKTGGVK